MATNITKQTDGSVRFDYTGVDAPYYFTNLDNVSINIDQVAQIGGIKLNQNILIISTLGSYNLPYASIGTINGVAKPATIQLTADLLVSSVFNSSGGGGAGTVTSVAGVAPDGLGNVPLTASNVGGTPIDTFNNYKTSNDAAVAAATPLFQTETTDYIKRVLLVGSIDIISANWIDWAITELKRIGAWSIIDEIWRPCGSNVAAAMVKIKYASAFSSPSSNTNNGYVEADYDQANGIGTGTVTNSAKYISSGFIPSTAGITTRNLSFGVFRPTATSLGGAGLASLMGVTPATGATGILTNETSVGILPTSYADFHGGIGMKSATYSASSQDMLFESHSAISIASAPTLYALDTELNYNRNRYNGTFYYASGKNGGGWIGRSMTKDMCSAVSKIFYKLNIGLGSLLQVGGVARFHGDSLTSGYGLSPSTLRWTTVLSQQKGVRELNFGMASRQLRQTVIQATGEFQSYTDANGLQCNFLYCLLGTNDMHIADVTTNGDATIIADLKTKYTTMVTDWKSQGFKIMLISPPWISDTNDTKITAYVNAVKEVAVASSVLFFDAYHPFLDSGVASTYFQADGTHFNAAGSLLFIKYLLSREQGSLIRNPTLDFPSIAANASATLTVNVPGASVDNIGVFVTPATGIDGVTLTASVTSADTVTVRAYNNTASAIDPASQKMTITVNQN